MQKRANITKAIEVIELEIYEDMKYNAKTLPDLIAELNLNYCCINSYHENQRQKKLKEKCIKSAAALIRIVAKLKNVS